MSKLLSSAKIIKILEELGFKFISQKGSHRKYRKGDHVVIVPSPKKEIPMGTFRSILRQSGLSAEDFYEELNFHLLRLRGNISCKNVTEILV